MGSNLALNLAEHGVPVAVHDRKPDHVRAFAERDPAFTGAETLADLAALSDRVAAAVAAGHRPEAEDVRRLGGIEWAAHGMALGMSQAHQTRIRRLLEASDRKMQFIVGYYLAFVLIGGGLIVAGGAVFSRTIAMPLRRLAAATLDLAAGDTAHELLRRR